MGAACIGDRVTFACNASSPSTLTLRWEHGGKVDDFYRNDDFPLRVVPPFNLTLMSSTPFLASVAELVVPAVFNAAIGAGISCFSRDASTQTLIKRGCVMLAGRHAFLIYTPAFMLHMYVVGTCSVYIIIYMYTHDGLSIRHIIQCTVYTA